MILIDVNDISKFHAPRVNGHNTDGPIASQFRQASSQRTYDAEANAPWVRGGSTNPSCSALGLKDLRYLFA